MRVCTFFSNQTRSISMWKLASKTASVHKYRRKWCIVQTFQFYVHPYFTLLKNSVINMTKLNTLSFRDYAHFEGMFEQCGFFNRSMITCPNIWQCVICVSNPYKRQQRRVLKSIFITYLYNTRRIRSAKPLKCTFWKGFLVTFMHKNICVMIWQKEN